MKPSNIKQVPKQKRTKYRNKPTYVDDIYFPSKREANLYIRLKSLVEAGEVTRFHRQVIFDLPGGTTCKCDFMVIYPDGSIRYLDAKGKILPSFIRNQKQVRALYCVEMEPV